MMHIKGLSRIAAGMADAKIVKVKGPLQQGAASGVIGFRTHIGRKRASRKERDGEYASGPRHAPPSPAQGKERTRERRRVVRVVEAEGETVHIEG